MNTTQFIRQIFSSHEKDQTVDEHAKTTVTGIVGCLRAIARNSMPAESEKLNKIADDLIFEFEYYQQQMK